MTEKEKMLAGELYIAEEAELAAEHARAIELCDRLDCGGISEEERDALTRQLLGKCGKNTVLGRGFRCDYGYNIEAGENFYVNFNVVILDVCKVKIGDNCLIAPQAGIYTAAHPLDAAVRRSGLEYGRPVTIGNDVWIGGGARILPGVTLGDNVVVGAGAVVTKSFPFGRGHRGQSRKGDKKTLSCICKRKAGEARWLRPPLCEVFRNGKSFMQRI